MSSVIITNKETPTIENISVLDVSLGEHSNVGKNSMLIRICDTFEPYMPTAKHQFLIERSFQFNDLERYDEFGKINPLFNTHGINDIQANHIFMLLKKALEENLNVVVHCTAGVSRSGAIHQVGIAMGFIDGNRFKNLENYQKNMVKYINKSVFNLINNQKFL